MAESFDTSTPEGRLLQFITLLGAKDMARDKIDQFLDTARPDLSNGEIKTPRQLILDDEKNFDLLLRLAEWENVRGIPDIIGIKPQP